MADVFRNRFTELDSPAERAVAVTPNDSTDLANACRAINVAAAGNVKITTVAGDEVTIYVAAGVPFPIRAARIWSTDTTATGIVALS